MCVIHESSEQLGRKLWRFRGQQDFKWLTPEKWPLPLEAYIAHTTLLSANTLQRDNLII
jgi:hypothetical protein